MFSWTIDGHEYTAPSKAHEITVGQWSQFMATATTSRSNPVKEANPRGIIARLTHKMRQKARSKGIPAVDDHAAEWLDGFRESLRFVQFWLGLPNSLVNRMDPDDITAIHVFLRTEWDKWE